MATMKKEKISMSIPADVIEAVRKQAESEHRNLSNMASVLLADALERRKEQEKAA